MWQLLQYFLNMEVNSMQTIQTQPVHVISKRHEEQVEEINIIQDVRPHTGSGIKSDTLANPEKPQYEQNKEDTKEEKSLWQSLAKWKKGLMIAAVVLILSGIVAGFTLLGLALAWRPQAKVNYSDTLKMPNSNQAITVQQVKVTDQNVFSPNVEATLEVTRMEGGPTLQQQGRLLTSESSSQLPPGIIKMVYQDQGVIVASQTPDDHTVYVDLDKAVIAYSKANLDQSRRLLQYLQMRNLQENIQTVADPTKNNFNFDNPPDLLAAAEDSLIRGVAQAIGANPQDIYIEYQNTTVANINPSGVYEVEYDTSKSSSRLLQALLNSRLLQEQWQQLFDNIVKDVVADTVSYSLSVVKEYGEQIAQAAQVSFTADEGLQLAGEQVIADARLLQKSENKTSDSSSSGTSNGASTNTTNSNGSGNKSSNNTSKQQKKKSFRKLKPISRRCTKNSTKTKKQRVVNEETYNSSKKCNGRTRRRRCNVEEFNSTKSAHQAKVFNESQVKKRGRYAISENIVMAKKIRPFWKKGGGKKNNEPQQTLTTPINNIPTTPANPTTPKNPTTPPTPVPTPTPTLPVVDPTSPPE